MYRLIIEIYNYVDTDNYRHNISEKILKYNKADRRHIIQLLLINEY